MEKIKVLIADDQTIIAEGLEALLSIEDDIEVVKTASTGIKVLEVLKECQIDVILMDIRMPEMNGVECTKHVVKDYPDCKILILTTFDDDEYITQALSNGAVGYMLKDLTADKLVAAIKNVYCGNTVMHQRITQKIISGIVEKKTNKELPHSVSGDMLTPRESQVLTLIAKGYTNTEIANELCLSIGTVKNYITLLYDKLNIKGRTKLITYAIDCGLQDEL